MHPTRFETEADRETATLRALACLEAALRRVPPLPVVEISRQSLSKKALEHAGGQVQRAHWFHETMQTGVSRPGADRLDGNYATVRYDTYNWQIIRWSGLFSEEEQELIDSLTDGNYEDYSSSVDVKLGVLQRQLYIWRCCQENIEILLDHGFAMLLFREEPFGWGSHGAFTT